MKRMLRPAALLPLFAVLVVSLASCGGGKTGYSHDAAGFEQIGNDLGAKFGADAYYTNLGMTDDGNGGTMLNVTVTNDPSSLRMEEWVLAADTWRQTAYITLEVEGGEAADFMFRLGREVDMKKFGAMVEQAKATVAAENNIQNPMMNLATVTAPDDDDISRMRYFVDIKPGDGGTSFYFHYNAQGELTTYQSEESF